MRLRSVVIVLTAVAVLVAPHSAEARRHRRQAPVASQVVIEGANPAGPLSGRVISDADLCLQDRIVRITRNNAAVGATTTDSSGRWFVNIGPSPAGSQVVVRVDQSTKRTGRRSRITCGPASDALTT